jgi:ornithine carbamoyltransferase
MFQKPSLRTRVSFELAMRQLGGQTVYLSPAEVGLGERESVADVARVLSRYVDALAVRTFSHQTLEALASYASVPVINALSDREHPCQALADLLTVCEKKGELAGLTMAYVGDGNNVARSLMLAAALSGMKFRIATPPAYAIDDETFNLAQNTAMGTGAEVFRTDDPHQAVTDADIVYTDVWTSMGQEAEAKARRKAFARYQVDAELLSLAREDAILMHPLPAHHGEEVAAGILDSPASVVFDQAENRLHLQKALLAALLGGLEIPLAGYR